jgi:hypothetical protein
MSPTFATFQILGAFAKWRKVSISFVTSVCLSVCLSACLPACPSVQSRGINRLPLDGLYEISYLSILQKSVQKIQILLESDKNEYFT